MMSYIKVKAENEISHVRAMRITIIFTCCFISVFMSGYAGKQFFIYLFIFYGALIIEHIDYVRLFLLSPLKSMLYVYESIALFPCCMLLSWLSPVFFRDRLRVQFWCQRLTFSHSFHWFTTLVLKLSLTFCVLYKTVVVDNHGNWNELLGLM